MSQQAKKEQIIELRNQGLSFREISKRLGISRSTIFSICKKANEGQHQCCKNCGILLKQSSGHRQKVFCSDKCRKEFWRNNRSNYAINNYATCLTCGKEFLYHDSRVRKYCSLNCMYDGKKKGVEDNEN